MSENKHYYKPQNTVRFSENELDFIDENYEIITETTERIPIKSFIIKAITGAVSMVKPKEVIKEVVKPSEEHLQKIAELENQVQFLKEANANLEKQIPSKSAIVLNFAPKWRKYIWGVLQVSKKQKFAESYEDLIQKVFTVVNKRNELVLTEEDLEYLDTLTYDDPENDPENQD